MDKKTKLKRIFKCSVRKCSNLVHHKGEFCKDCIEKLTSDFYIINYCPYCENIIDIFFHNNDKIPFEDRFQTFICANCITKLENDFDLSDE